MATYFLLQRTVHISDEIKEGQEDIVPYLHNPLTEKKGDFLLNKLNKQAFLEMFGAQFSGSGISIMHSD